jgi:hypothetical protein
MPRAKMNLPVAYRQFLVRRRKTVVPRREAHYENGLARETCRGHGENSNASIARSPIHSGFIAAAQAATTEIFSSKFRLDARSAGPDRYSGANPKARWKRLA